MGQVGKTEAFFFFFFKPNLNCLAIIQEDILFIIFILFVEVGASSFGADFLHLELEL